MPASDQPDEGAEFRIAGDGAWYYRNSPIGRPALVKLFSSVLRREADGRYWLVTPVERRAVAVEDAPFTAVELAAEGAGETQVLRLRTNVGDWVEAGPEHPIRVATAPDSAGPRPYILVRDGLEAVIVRSVYYRLVELGLERAHNGRMCLGVWSGGAYLPLGFLD